MEALANLAPLIIIAGLFWFLLIRPAQRRQREAHAVQQSATPGSQVMLTSGIYGTVTDTEDEWLHVEISAGTVVKVARGAIARVFEDEPGEDPETSETAETTGENDGQ